MIDEAVAYLSASGRVMQAAKDDPRTIDHHPVIRIVLSVPAWAEGKPPAHEVTALVESVQQIAAFYGANDAEDK